MTAPDLIEVLSEVGELRLAIQWAHEHEDGMGQPAPSAAVAELQAAVRAALALAREKLPGAHIEEHAR
jgi:hypothetical protein